MGWSLPCSAKDLLLKARFARDRSAFKFQYREDDPLSASSSYLRHGVQLISTVIQRWNACRIHAAAAEYFSTVRYTGTRLPPGLSGWTISRKCAA